MKSWNRLNQLLTLLLAANIAFVSCNMVDKFSIITPTYQRDSILGNYLNRYAINMPKEVPELHKIYIVWMNVERKPEDAPIVAALKSKLNVPVEFIIPPKNDLNYRFLIPNNLETEAVFTFDDDLIIKPKDIRKAFYEWKSKFDGKIGPITGFVQRDYRPNRIGELDYVCDTREHYSMILTGACFLCREFLELYNHLGIPEVVSIRKFVSENFNGEDIGMNFLVAAHYPNHPPHWIRNPEYAEDPSVNHVGLSYQPDHVRKRNKALTDFTKLFGRNPLIRVKI